MSGPVPGLGPALVGFSGRPVLTFIGATTLGDVNSATHTFTNHAIGAASADRLVIVACTRATSTSGASCHFTSVTIGGVSATLIASGDTTHNPTAIAYLAVASGTTATIISTASDAGSAGSINVWTLTGYNSATPTASATDNTVSAAALSASYTISAGGVLMAVASCAASSTRTYTGLTGTKQADVGGGTGNAFDSDAGGSGTLTCTFNSATYGSMTLASWR